MKRCHIHNCCIFVCPVAVLVAAFFALLFVAGVFDGPEPTTSTLKNQNTEPPTCPDLSWEIGNGECEGTTNIEECDFDGGDCCKPDSRIKYNYNRSGIQTCHGPFNHQDNMTITIGIEKMDAYNESMLAYGEPKIRYSDVSSTHICTKLCLQYDWLDGWTYLENQVNEMNETKNVCECWQYRQCFQNETDTSNLIYDNSSTTYAYDKNRIQCLPENCTWPDIALDFSSTTKMTIYNVSTPEYCQARCQEKHNATSESKDAKCLLFSWTPGKGNNSKGEDIEDACVLIKTVTDEWTLDSAKMSVNGTVSGPRQCPVTITTTTTTIITTTTSTPIEGNDNGTSGGEESME